PLRGDLPAGTAGYEARTVTPSPDAKILFHRGQDNQAAGIIAWPTAGGFAQIRESRQLEILTQVFQNRLLDRLREKLGEAYSPQVVNAWPIELQGGGNVMAIANLQPKSVPIFFATAEGIATDLATTPPTAEELNRVTEPLKQALNRASSSSAFFMYLIEGGTSEPARYRSVRSLLSDYTETTPQAMQALAAKYFGPGRSWRLAVIPQGQRLVQMPVPTSIAAPAPGR
ncbi:MAG: insulinase family protein, partial [Sphingomonadales bacterium]|nr:insulinase family protein [Sphingomonadales bacterium]